MGKKYSAKESFQLALNYMLEHPQGISQKIFTELTGLKSRTTFTIGFKAALIEAGYNVVIEKIGKTAFYKLENTDIITPFQQMSKEDYYEYLIIETLETSPSGMTFLELYNELLSANTFGERDNPLSLEKSSLRTRLNNMEENGLISSQLKGRGAYIYKTINHSNILTCNSSKLNEIYQMLSLVPSSHKHHKLLESAKNKIRMEVNPTVDQTNDNFIIYGKEYRSFANINEDLSILRAVDYPHKIIGLTYDQDGIVVKSLFAVGAIIYSSISDEIYVVGKIKSTAGDDGRMAYMALSSISTATETEYENTEYYELPQNTKTYESLIESMLDISVDTPTKLKAEIVSSYLPTAAKIKRVIDNRSQIRKQNYDAVARYSSRHKNAVDNTIVYEDEISDIDTIKPFLLGFGRALKDISPDGLKIDIRDELEEALKRYEQEGFHV